jgi:hypothetical protein
VKAVPLELRKVATVLAIAIVMTSAFAAAYTVALGRPIPRHMPVAMVGAPTAQLLSELQVRQHEFDLRTYPSREAAITAIDDQRVTAIIDASATPPELLISSAGDPSSARVLTQLDQSGAWPSRLQSSTCIPCRPRTRRVWRRSTS